MAKKFDCSGWATKANVLCSDGRTIMKNAFKECDGTMVPVVWNHQHNSVNEVLGHALLENRDNGVYAYVNFNDTDQGQNAKLLVQHGDVTKFSIYANRLKQQGGNVVHGIIRELSLVLAGANPGAVIDTVMMHGEDSYEEGYIEPDEYIENVESIFHSDTAKKGEERMAKKNNKNADYDDRTVAEVFDTFSDKQKNAVYAIIGLALEEAGVTDDVRHADYEDDYDDDYDDDETIAEVFDTLTEDQKTVAYAMIGQALEDAGVEYEDDDNYEDDEEFGHSDYEDDDDETIAEVFDTLTDDQKTAAYAMIGQALEDAGVEYDDDEEFSHSDYEDDEYDYDDEAIAEVFDTFSDKQQAAVSAIIDIALDEAGTDEFGHSDYDYYYYDDDYEGGNNFMKHNIFDQDFQEDDMDVLSHSEMLDIMEEAQATRGSLKDTFLSHGITNIDYLFPDAQSIDKEPQFIKRQDDWVSAVMDGVHKTPFSRIKSLFANITEAEARARGYIKGNMKVEEVFTLLKRTTTPTTIYKKQKFDRDDLLDITEFDTVAWVKKELRMMLDEETARAILIGDGRISSSEDKINEQNIRPIWTDEDLFTVKSLIPITGSTTATEKAKAFIKASVKSRKQYKGSGNPTMFMSEDLLTDLLLIEDTNGRVIYDTEAKLATALRVKKIVPVSVMEGLKREVGAKTHFLGGIYVNLDDYNVGADKGGAINMFDDFDIDYNQQKYLLETRCSGALIKPYAAVAIEFTQDTSSLNS